MKSHKGRILRALSTLLISAAAVTVFASAASAHVTVFSPDATKAGFGKLVFRVPNESPTATTQKVEISLPADKPFAFVSSKPITGWEVQSAKTKLDKPVTADGETITEAITHVTWTAQGTGISTGQFQEFELSVGPFPDTDSITFQATQTYSDGQTVLWDQTQKAGAQEPEHPAPTLSLTSTTKADDSDNVARWLAGASLALAVIALAIAGIRRHV